MTVALDTWAIICLLDEVGPAARRVSALLDRETPVMSWVNLAEVAYVVERRHGKDAATRAVRDLLDRIDVESAGRRPSLAAATLKAELGLSLGDAYAAATALAHDGTLWTGDPDLLRPDATWKHEDLRTKG